MTKEELVVKLRLLGFKFNGNKKILYKQNNNLIVQIFCKDKLAVSRGRIPPAAWMGMQVPIGTTDSFRAETYEGLYNEAKKMLRSL